MLSLKTNILSITLFTAHTKWQAEFKQDFFFILTLKMTNFKVIFHFFFFSSTYFQILMSNGKIFR